MKPYRAHLFFVLLLVSLLFAGPAMALDLQGSEPVGDYGSIDWQSLRVTATGLGVAGPNAMNAAHARILAREAAKVVAQRNLLEVVKGVHIDAQTTVKNYMVQDDTIVSRVEGVIKSAQIEDYAFAPDGSCTATISMPLTGELSQIFFSDQQTSRYAASPPSTDTAMASRLARLEKRIEALEEHVNSLQKIRFRQEALSDLFLQLVSLLAENQSIGLQPVALTTSGTIKELQANQTRIMAQLETLSKRLAALEKTPSTPATAGPASGNQAGYTGLVIDARGSGFKPCLRPNIFGKSKLIYPGSYVDRHIAVRQGYARFYRDLRQAQQSATVGSLPYTITVAKALKGSSRTIFLPDTASDELSAIIGDSDNFMSRCRVVIVF
jgi:hypothetical protein